MSIVEPNAFAIIIAIENYRNSGSVGAINSVEYAHNDAVLFKDMLVNEFGLSNSNVIMLLDQNATKTALENDLPYHIRNLSPGDRFYFYYAGHGFYKNGSNRLTVWDTNSFNLEGTTVCLNEILLKPLEASQCSRSLIFIDACASDLVDIVASRDLLSDMNKDEFEQFINSGGFQAVFTSCSPSEKSYPSNTLKHGIWTWHVINALKGSAPDAIVKEEFITDSSLANYLKKAVPEYIRKNTTIRATQTPYAKISSSGTFEIRKLPALESPGNPDLPQLALDFDNYILRKQEFVGISRLPGFSKSKGHFVPDKFSEQTSRFIRERTFPR